MCSLHFTWSLKIMRPMEPKEMVQAISQILQENGCGCTAHPREDSVQWRVQPAWPSLTGFR